MLFPRRILGLEIWKILMRVVAVFVIVLGVIAWVWLFTGLVLLHLPLALLLLGQSVPVS